MSVTLDAGSALDGAAATTLAGLGLTLGTRNSIRCKVLLHQRIHLPIVCFDTQAAAVLAAVLSSAQKLPIFMKY